MQTGKPVNISILTTILLTAIIYLAGCGTTEPQTEADAVSPDTSSVVIMGTTDLHGYVRAWDYYRDEGGLDYSMSRVATLIDSVRVHHPEALLLDAGDWLQGNSFAEYFARVDEDESHYPLLEVADFLEYDAFVLGNHEFDYGISYLNRQIDQTDTPIIGANVFYHDTEDPAYLPYIIREVGEVKVAVLGLNTPGTAVWNRSRVEGKLDFRDGAEVASRFVPKLKEEKGADVVVVLAHSAFDGDDSYTEEGVAEENFGRSIMEQVPDVDAFVLGHRHRTFEKITEGLHGGPVAVIESGRWGSHLGIIKLKFVDSGGEQAPEVIHAETRMHSTAHADEHPGVVELVEDAHQKVRDYVNQPVATTPDKWSAEHARERNTPIIELIHRVQLEKTGAQLSAAAAFNTNVDFGPGDIRRGDIEMLYPYENTLYKLELTGRQIRDFLEYTSRYYLKPEDGVLKTNPEWPGFNYDMLSGVDYELDLRHEPGERVVRLEYQGEPIQDEDTFTVAINSYRAEGGGGFQMLAEGRVLEEIDISVRDMIISYLKEKGEISASEFEEENWKLIY